MSAASMSLYTMTAYLRLYLKNRRKKITHATKYHNSLLFVLEENIDTYSRVTD